MRIGIFSLDVCRELTRAVVPPRIADPIVEVPVPTSGIRAVGEVADANLPQLPVLLKF